MKDEVHEGISIRLRPPSWPPDSVLRREETSSPRPLVGRQEMEEMEVRQQSTSAALEELIDSLVRRKGLAYVERQYDSGLMSGVVEPAFEQWKKRQATRRRAAPRVPAALIAVMLLVAYFALAWSV
ncbi:MAG: hypothetical protein EPO12_13755 [Aquabacterium sp.]|nr:MAG: hypothetical protein EPO12_13755 [Aquabacterium sp.]